MRAREHKRQTQMGRQSFIESRKAEREQADRQFARRESGKKLFISFLIDRHKRRKRAKYLSAASLMQRQASRPIHQRTSPSPDDSISSASSTLNPRHPVPSYGGAMTYYPSQADQGDGSPSRTGGPMLPSSRSFGNGFQTTSNQVQYDLQANLKFSTEGP